jgi:hypothetical protein
MIFRAKVRKSTFCLIFGWFNFKTELRDSSKIHMFVDITLLNQMFRQKCRNKLLYLRWFTKIWITFTLFLSIIFLRLLRENHRNLYYSLQRNHKNGLKNKTTIYTITKCVIFVAKKYNNLILDVRSKDNMC